ncbi:MFS transporter [Pseudodesulfovibrio portus]|nr:MFS transporter [Pseudodesulfovibrio portus]
MSRTDRTPASAPFATALPAVMLVAAIFFLNFISRVILAPLMPVVQADLGFTHAGAGYLFLSIALGNGTGLLLSGFVSRAWNHRRTVGLSAIAVGGLALITPLADSYQTLIAAVFGLGVGAGLYLPSGIAAITSLVRKEDWGKALAVHELAPNLSFVSAPLLAEAALFFFDWRTALTLIGGVQICLGLWFLKAGRGGDFPGLVPTPAMAARIVRRPVFWLLVLFFSLAIGANVGPYSMLPLYLVDAHGFSRPEANQLLSYSRIAACFVPFAAGWITDKWGARLAILLGLCLTGASLVALGLASGRFLVAMALVEPVCSVILFAPAFTMLSMSFDPAERSVAVALIGPCNAVLGMGLVPTFLGLMGDAGRFDTGFLVLGAVMASAALLLPLAPGGKA